MFKDLLIKCCNFIGREDIVCELKSAEKLDDILNNNIKNDVINLFSYYNYVVCSVFENYLNLSFTEKVTSNSNSIIEYFVLSHRAIEILKLEDENFINQNFIVKTNFIVTPNPNKNYFLTYRYTPDLVKDLTENIILPKNLNEKILCYGIASEFLASKGKFEESEYFNDKFLYEIFKIKTQKERRLKSTFCI